MKDKNSDVLQVLIENSRENISISDVSRELDMDYKNVYNIVKRLNKEGLIALVVFGKTINCILRKKPHPLFFETEYKRREKLLRNKNIGILHEKLNSLPFSFIALIFGSFAKYKTSKGSDIDLMVICEKNREKEIESIISLLPLNIHLTTLIYSQFLKMANSKKFSVVSEVLKRNIILIGIEDYYRLVENVK